MKRYRLLKASKIAAIAIIAVTAMGFVVMSLWNVLMPAVFALHAITFWQALGLLLLSKLLFGGFRPGFRSRQHWRQRMAERFEKMTPEEREKFKQGMRCGRGPGQPNPPAEAHA